MSREKTIWSHDEGVRSIFQAAESVAFILTTCDADPLILDFSTGAEKIFDYARGEILGKPLSSLHVPEDLEMLEAMREMLRLQKTGYRGEANLVRRGGQRFSSLISTYPLIDHLGNANALLTICLDISEWKQTREALFETTQRFSALIDNAPLGAYEYEYLAEKDELIFSGFNRAANTIMDFDHSALIGKTIGEAFPGLATTPVPAAFKTVARTGIPFEEKHLNYKDGNVAGAYEFAAFRAAQNHVIILFRDITEQWKLDETLKRNEERYRDLVNNSPNAIIFCDLQGTILQANPRAAEYYRFPSTERMVGVSGFDLVAPEKRPLAREILRNYQGEGVFRNFEYEALRKDGTRFPVDASGVLVRDDQGRAKGLMITIQDYTEKARAQADLKESEQRFRTLFETMGQGVVYQNADGTIVSANPAALRILGLTLDQMMGKTSLDPRWKSVREDGTMFPGDQHPIMVSLKTGKPVENVVMGVHIPEEEHYRWLMISATPEFREGETAPFRAFAVFTDISRLRETETHLEHTRSLFLAALEQNPAGIMIADAPRVQIRLVNRAAEEILLMSREEQLCVSLDSHANITYRSFRPDGTPYADEQLPLVRTLTANETFRNLELRVVRHDGSERWIMIHGGPICDQDGKTIAGIIVFQDVTERRKLELQMQHTQKLESLGVLAGGIAHDFNNLLMAILGNIDLALNILPLYSPVRSDLQAAEKASHRAADLCRQMLAYSGRGRFVVRPIELNQVIQEMASMLEVTISKKASLRFQFSEHLPAFEGDVAQIHQVVMNLIINASEAIGEHEGLICVKTRVTTCSRAFLDDFGFEENLPVGTYVVLEVADSGCGMDRETRRKIFDPFFTTKFMGRGLGLSAVLGIVRGHRGALTVTSEPQKGTTFMVFFPALEKSREEDPKAAVTTPEWRGRGTVLLVDDEEFVREICQRYLEALGFKVITAEDGQRGIDLFVQHQADIICVLLDLTMPHKDGEEVFTELRSIRPDVKVVLASGYSELEVDKRFVGKGLAGFIQKPFQLEQLRQALKQIIPI